MANNGIVGLFFCLRQYLANVVQAGLKLAILLLQPPDCWDYGHASPHLVHWWFFKEGRRLKLACSFCLA
jgi:hypothetical protein